MADLQSRARDVAEKLCEIENGGGYKEQHEFADAIAAALVDFAREHAERAVRGMFKVEINDWEQDEEDRSADIMMRDLPLMRSLLGCGCCADRHKYGPGAEEFQKERIAAAAAEVVEAAEREGA